VLRAAEGLERRRIQVQSALVDPTPTFRSRYKVCTKAKHLPQSTGFFPALNFKKSRSWEVSGCS
jgi:hypothetical protein